MISTGYYFIYRDSDLEEYIVLKHDKYKLSRINDLVEEFVLSDMAMPNQAKFLRLLEKKPSLILDIYNAMNVSLATDTPSDYESLNLDNSDKELNMEVDFEGL